MSTLTEEIRKERERIEKDMKPKRKVKTRIDLMIPDITKSSGKYIKRSYGLDFDNPAKLLPKLEYKILREFAIMEYTLKSKLRYQEIIQAKRMFIFFATTYLNLQSATVAKYLNMERSTLSYHVHCCIDEIDYYKKFRDIADKIDEFLYEKADRVSVQRPVRPGPTLQLQDMQNEL